MSQWFSLTARQAASRYRSAAVTRRPVARRLRVEHLERRNLLTADHCLSYIDLDSNQILDPDDIILGEEQLSDGRVNTRRFADNAGLVIGSCSFDGASYTANPLPARNWNLVSEGDLYVFTQLVAEKHINLSVVGGGDLVVDVEHPIAPFAAGFELPNADEDCHCVDAALVAGGNVKLRAAPGSYASTPDIVLSDNGIYAGRNITIRTVDGNIHADSSCLYAGNDVTIRAVRQTDRLDGTFECGVGSDLSVGNVCLEDAKIVALRDVFVRAYDSIFADRVCVEAGDDGTFKAQEDGGPKGPVPDSPGSPSGDVLLNDSVIVVSGNLLVRAYEGEVEARWAEWHAIDPGGSILVQASADVILQSSELLAWRSITARSEDRTVQLDGGACVAIVEGSTEGRIYIIGAKGIQLEPLGGTLTEIVAPTTSALIGPVTGDASGVRIGTKDWHELECPCDDDGPIGP